MHKYSGALWPCSGKGFSMCVYSKTKGLFCASHKVGVGQDTSLVSNYSNYLSKWSNSTPCRSWPLQVHRWHHSSLLAGESCMFAGELKVERGIVKVLTNKSGHYKPGEEATLKVRRSVNWFADWLVDLLDCIVTQMLEELAARGMDLSDVIFHFVDKRGESQRHNTLDLLKTLQEKHHQTK